jgi:hypothetical protein
VSFCQIVFNFHTIDTVSLDFISIDKILTTYSQVVAVSEDTGLQEFITSSNGNLAMIVRVRDAE